MFDPTKLVGYCVWCEHRFPVGTEVSEVVAHISGCPEHPLAQALAREAALKEELRQAADFVASLQDILWGLFKSKQNDATSAYDAASSMHRAMLAALAGPPQSGQGPGASPAPAPRPVPSSGAGADPPVPEGQP